VTWAGRHAQDRDQTIHARPIHSAITNTDGEHAAAAIPAARRQKSDVMVFATEDEQEALTEQMSSVWYDTTDGGLKQARGRCILFMVSQIVFFCLTNRQHTRRVPRYGCIVMYQLPSVLFTLLIFCHQLRGEGGAKALATELAHNVMCSIFDSDWAMLFSLSADGWDGCRVSTYL
jgi:hypothetical protein